jgi:(1->4)-alpha-D-glucan 1-alpha-D-glucosylmutase
LSPRATYRLQLSREFTLADAAAIVPYLARLGISHLYCSPLLTARAGSGHGYDVVDHEAINPELGGMPALRALADALRSHGLGLLLDIVPNHMGIGGADNRLWLDVLEWGRASPYATWFDIDWEAGDDGRGKILLPCLGDPYGVALANGQVALRFDPAEATISAWYFEHRLPIAPRDYPIILRRAADAVADEAEALFAARVERGPVLRAMFASWRRRLAARLAGDAATARAIEAALARFDAAETIGRERLHQLLERQNYRLAWWRAAADEINYRRFFNINDLAGLRVEVPAAFDATHDLILRLWRDGLIDGVRIDHIDGLAEPRAYCRKLRRRMEAIADARPSGLSREPWIVVEKILARHQTLLPGWQADGTTGYDFMDAVGALLHDPVGEVPLTELHEELAGRRASFHDEEVAARRQVLRDHFAAELNATARAVHRNLRADLATRDFTLTGVRRALTEMIAHFPSYRTYVTRSGPSQEDRTALDWALAEARRDLRPVEWPLLDAIAEVVSGRGIRATGPGQHRREMLLAIRRFQQLTAPVAAKAVEDTAFYRYVRLLSRNEVGANPGRFALPPAAFRRFLQRLRRTPATLLATATHDHKRGEDTRARLIVLSERAGEWITTVHRWVRLNAPLKTEVHGKPAPSAVDEHQLYQTLVGAWPPALDPADREGLDRFIARIEAWLLKALREAKVHTDWAVGDEHYEQAAVHFLRAALDPERTASFVAEVAALAEQLRHAGQLKSLAQTALKCWSVGVPDFYQGSELWDFSLVDPDNRAPVDFAARAHALEAALTAPPTDAAAWQDGRLKQWMIHRLLALRHAVPELFVQGKYLLPRLGGEAAEALFAQMVAHGDQAALLIVPRLTGESGGEPFTRAVLTLPESFADARARCVFSDRTLPIRRRVELAQLATSSLPVIALALDKRAE